ncbi:MAG TPA: rhamnulokinase family protein [Ruminiclostridium sp.]
MSKGVLAFDFGASSGRAMLGCFENGKIELKEIHRFKNTPIYENDNICWDIQNLFGEIKKSLALCDEYESIGIDTWGVDFGFVDESGKIIKNPVNYRDPRTKGMIEKVSEKISRDKLYSLTGNQIMEINTVFQLYYELLYNKEIFDSVDKILLMPDLLNFLLTGEMKAERSIASTTQLIDPYKKQWNDYILDQLGIRKDIFPALIPSGTEIGLIKEDIAIELNIERKTVIAVCGHDTASAVAAVPAEQDFIFISCGTWALFGTELQEPVITDKSLAYNLTNEIGINGTTRFMKNLTGLWLLQETKKQFESENKSYSFDELEQLAKAAEAFKCFIDTDLDRFMTPGDIPQRIKEYASETGQRVPQTDGEVVRCIYDSLAFKYRYTYEQISECLGKKYEKIHIVGGGSRDSLLCQMAAEASGLEVIAGPVEATAIGNIIVQLIARGEIKNLEEGRKIIKASFETIKYVPIEHDSWNKEYERYKNIIK